MSIFKGKRKTVLLAALAVPAIMALWLAPVRAADKITIVFAGNGLEYELLDIAMQQGFLTQQNLEPQIVNLSSGPAQVAAIMGGSADISLQGMTQLVKAHAQGDNQLVAITTFLDGIDIGLVLSDAAIKKTGIEPGMTLDEKVKRLHDIRVAITGPGSSTDLFIRTLLVKRGIDPQQALQIQPLGGGDNMLAALQKGVTDGFVWGAPQAQVAELKKYGQIVVDPFSVPELRGVPYLGVVTTRASIAKNPELFRRFALAMVGAINFAHANPDKAKAIVQSVIQKEYPDFSSDLFNAAWPTYYKLIPTSPVMSAEQVDRVAKWIDITAPAPLTLNAGDLVYPKFAEEAEKASVAK